MKLGVKLKFLFFEHYWWMLCMVLAFTVAILIWRKEPTPTVATAIGAIISFIYLVQKQKLEELRLFRELFKDFNERYDEMNEKLARIADRQGGEVSSDERETLVDYFNLCGEEHLYFQRGYIDPAVWRAWLNGMKAIVSVPHIKTVWEQERQTDSYYGLPL